MAKQKNVIRRSPDTLHFLLSPLARLYLKFKFNTSVEVNELPKDKEPFFLIGHHVTAFDAVISAAYSPRMIRFIAGDANWDSPIKRFFFKIFDVIPFSKNTSDVKSVMRLRKVAKAGYPVSLYPEGGRNWDGSTDKLIESTAKLIKMLKLPVYTIFYQGGYLSKPRWGSYFRKGKMILRYERLMTADDVKNKSILEIGKVMSTGIQYNEYDWQRTQMIPFKGKHLAEHVERLIYKCPNCESLDSFHSKDNDFTCSECGITYTINKYGFVEGCDQYDNFSDWNKWQATAIKPLSETDFEMVNIDLPLDVIDKSNHHDEHLADITLRKEGLKIIHKLNPENLTVEQFSINEIRGISVSFLDWVECFIGDLKYRMKFDPTKHTSVKLFYDMITYLKAESKSDELDG